ncbi:MAG: hypothetical protein ACK5NB_03155 [Flavobacteriaceae bacterium]
MTAKIRLAYRMVIDANAQTTWEKYIFEDTYKEYLLQHQKFNTTENLAKTFRELLSVNDKASQLHFLTGIAANGYINQLKGNLYNVPDVLGNNFFPIDGFKTDIVNTDITNISKHKIGITFFSCPLVLIDRINNCYLVSKEVEKNNGLDTLMFPFRENLSICYYESLL